MKRGMGGPVPAGGDPRAPGAAPSATREPRKFVRGTTYNANAR